MEFPISNTGRNKIDVFVNGIAPLVCEEWLDRHNKGDKTISPAVVISQAALESGWNLNAKTLFGIKGEGFSSETSEYINGHYVTITDSFKSYPTIAAAVKGYFDLIQNSIYDNATKKLDYEEECRQLYECGYATDPNYSDKLISIIDMNNLHEYNEYVDTYNYDTPCEDISFKNKCTDDKSDEEIAYEVYLGLWGNGEVRRESLEHCGRNYENIRKIVNDKYYGIIETEENEDERIQNLAAEIYNGDYGNGRENRLALALENGYTEVEYNKAQELVNEMCKEE